MPSGVDDELLVRVVGTCPAEVQESLEIETDLLRVVTEHLDDLAHVVALVACAHRCVGREDRALAGRRERLVA